MNIKNKKNELANTPKWEDDHGRLSRQLITLEQNAGRLSSRIHLLNGEHADLTNQMDRSRRKLSAELGKILSKYPL